MKNTNQPVAPKSGNRLRVAIYSRYSTAEQNPRSIDDQILINRQHLRKLGISDYDEIVYSDAEISGRKKHRPGIDEVLQSIDQGRIDILIAEDVSRLYRKTAFATDLFARAIDAKVRVLTVNDGIDTNDPKWRVLTQVQAIHAEMHLSDTSFRIRRAFEGRWKDGCAINPLLPGYIRDAATPDSDDPKKRGPYRDRKDDQWTSVIHEAYLRAARGDRLRDIADYFNISGLPRSRKAKCPFWTPVLVRRLLQQELYRGREVYRRKSTRALEVSGDSIQEYTSDELILRRDMPHLAHVPDWLWEAANEKIRCRRTRSRFARGTDHPTTGIPRDSWGPLSNILFCGSCGSRMHRDGAGYRCSASKARWTLSQGDGRRCWNRCSPQPHIVHAQIGTAIVEALMKHTDCFDAIESLVERLIQDGDGSREGRLRDLDAKRASLSRVIAKLQLAVEEASDVRSIVDQLRLRETELAEVERELAMLHQASPGDIPLPTRDQLIAEIERIKPTLLESMGREAGAILRNLVGRIEARPYQAIDSNRIILRAHFELNLVKLLPAQWQSFVECRIGSTKCSSTEKICTIPMCVDLFERPAYVRFAQEVHGLREAGVKLSDVMADLGISRDIAKAATKAGRLMEKRGVTDFYAPLAERPEFKSKRWRDDSASASQDDPGEDRGSNCNNSGIVAA